MYLNSDEEGLEKRCNLVHIIGIHSYEPSGSKAIEMISCLFPLKCGVYESIPMNQLALKEKIL